MDNHSIIKQALLDSLIEHISPQGVASAASKAAEHGGPVGSPLTPTEELRAHSALSSASYDRMSEGAKKLVRRAGAVAGAGAAGAAGLGSRLMYLMGRRKGRKTANKNFKDIMSGANVNLKRSPFERLREVAGGRKH